jgi:hypothetical protein
MAQSIRDEMSLRAKLPLKSEPTCSGNGEFSYEIVIEGQTYLVNQSATQTRYQLVDDIVGNEDYLVENDWIGELLVPEKVSWKTGLGVRNSIPYSQFMKPTLAIPHKNLLTLAMRYATISHPVMKVCCESESPSRCFSSEFPEIAH